VRYAEGAAARVDNPDSVARSGRASINDVAGENPRVAGCETIRALAVDADCRKFGGYRSIASSRSIRFSVEG
jgi:hypothetical protein